MRLAEAITFLLRAAIVIIGVGIMLTVVYHNQEVLKILNELVSNITPPVFCDSSKTQARVNDTLNKWGKPTKLSPLMRVFLEQEHIILLFNDELFNRAGHFPRGKYKIHDVRTINVDYQTGKQHCSALVTGYFGKFWSYESIVSVEYIIENTFYTNTITYSPISSGLMKLIK